MTGCGHEDCIRMTGPRGYPRLCLHAGERHAGVDTATAVLHQHVWQYRGMTPGGLLVMVCDGHPEPVVRLVRATVEDDR